MKWTTIARFAILPALAGCAAGSDEIDAGRHVIFSYPAEQPPDQLLDLIKEGKVGGVILFGDNVGDDLADVVQNLQDTYSQSPAYDGQPLLIMTDQEGGQVRRLPGGPELSAKEIGNSEDPTKAATKAGDEAAKVLNESNVNSNLAPILGVYRKEGDFLDSAERSYGTYSSIVADCASAFISAQQSAGVLASAKHFPGLGLATEDENTDERPVTLDAPLKTLRGVDEEPYEKAIKAGVAMVMPSWAIYSDLDSEYPAGLSKAWLKDELRDRLGFKGVTISDTIAGGGLENFGDIANRTVLASQAGMDIILGSGMNVTIGEMAVDAIVAGLDDGSLPRDSFDAATKRIVELRKKL